jgi:Formin Homology 2 Domain
MTAEQIEHIIEYLPTKEERRALEAFMLEGGQDAAEKSDGLCECEKFMVSMMTVKHAKRKVRALLFKLQFESCLEALYQGDFFRPCPCFVVNDTVHVILTPALFASRNSHR